MTYEELELLHEDIIIKEVDFSNVDPEGDLSGICVNNRIYISKTLETNTEKACVLAEEIGHYMTSSGNTLDQKDTGNRKQEKRARNWAYEKLVPFNRIIEAYKIGVRNRNELAEHLGVVEEFLEAAIAHYKEKYGFCAKYGDYYIYFEPFGVLVVLNERSW